MEKLLSDLKKIIRFKDTTQIGDIVLIVADNPQMLAYALVAAIKRDESKKDEWWQVTMHVLAVPPQKITWILRTPQLTGEEIFTMNGEQRFVKALDFFNTERPEDGKGETVSRKKTELKLVK
jgi:hypothetical protein